MYHCILVPLDGSKRAESILPHVEAIALRFKSKVVFLQVVEPPPILMGPETPYLEGYQKELEQRTKEADLYLTSVIGEFREKGIESRTRVIHGPVVGGIIDTAESESADLIAISSHGRTGLSRVFYGSIAVGILHRADRPLLLIRSE
ncbi:MAG: universal stress protein [Desulfatiglandaceae bacterium]|jgi:nucleotide-binding universal stress UspA family protein